MGPMTPCRYRSSVVHCSVVHGLVEQFFINSVTVGDRVITEKSFVLKCCKACDMKLHRYFRRCDEVHPPSVIGLTSCPLNTE